MRSQNSVQSVWKAGVLAVMWLVGCAATGEPTLGDGEVTGVQTQANTGGPRLVFGTSTTDVYANGGDGKPWQENTPGHWAYLNAFRAQVRTFATEGWVFPLEGAWWMHDGSDTGDGGADTVDFLLVGTHGASGFYKEKDVSGNYYDGAEPVRDPEGREAAVLSMEWDGESVWSTHMRLGDNGRQLSVLALEACNTLRLDGKQIDRWDAAFRGGLRMLLSHEGMHYIAGGGAAVNLANRFKANEPLAHAWHYGQLGASRKHKPTVMTTGATSEECYSRLSGIRWKNMDAFRRIRDNENAWFCWQYASG